uniref:Uncharacterized protein n=1 Tax=Anguilla anguilla TaxID=7936 RepID=A0A0E9XKH4_ANGAN
MLLISVFNFLIYTLLPFCILPYFFKHYRIHRFIFPSSITPLLLPYSTAPESHLSPLLHSYCNYVSKI